MVTSQQQLNLEATGQSFSLRQLLMTRRITRDALWEIAGRMRPGMTEEEGRAVADDVLATRGLLGGWHKVLVRFGPNTARSFDEASDHDVVLGRDDVFFIDIGPIFEGYEGDAGDTFVTGRDLDMGRLASDVKELWWAVREQWRYRGMTGDELYRFAAGAAESMGWELDLGLTGHRLSEFPHSAHYDGTLSEVPFRPSGSRWVLEIQIRHPEREIGGFFEDLLVDDDILQRASYEPDGPVGGAELRL